MTFSSESSDVFPFAKMAGHGNDFIIIDNRNRNYSEDWTQLAKKWCRRRVAIGADGLLLIESSSCADFKLRIINADGSEAEMCGNGARCATAYAIEKGIAGNYMNFETIAGIIKAKVCDQNDVAIKLTDPAVIEDEKRIRMGDLDFSLYSVNSGVPHAIIFTEDLQKLSEYPGTLSDLPEDTINKIGREVRFHPLFEPAGTNVDFVEVFGPGQIRVRTYERGVEAETLACGTGAVASSILSYKFGNAGGLPMFVEMRGGTLVVDFKVDGGSFGDVWLRGKVNWIYNGEIIPSQKLRI